MKYGLVVFAVAAFLCVPVRAVAGCTAPIYSEFDFWVGNWRVTNQHGKLLGYDDVSKTLDGCVVYERYRDAIHPSVGIGLSGYDAGRKQWHQDFMDDTGFVLALNGTLQNGRMVLEGIDYANGKPRLNRGVWQRHGDLVEELWTISTDGGRSWKTQFDGWFHRLGSEAP
jgi:hypothetical protein